MRPEQENGGAARSLGIELAAQGYEPVSGDTSDKDPELQSGGDGNRKHVPFYGRVVAGVLMVAVLATICIKGSYGPPGPAIATKPEDATLLAAIPEDYTKVNLLFYHNMYRCMHGAKPVVWNPTVASSASSDVDRYGTGHSPRPWKYGENLKWDKCPLDPKSQVKWWYDEVSVYPKNKWGASHFTQVVWKSTKYLGCAQKVTSVWYGKQCILHCQYDPKTWDAQGNGFKENVQGSALWSKSSCYGAGYALKSRRYGTPKSGDSWQIKEDCVCTDVCGKRGESYNWCYVSGCKGYSWDYCTPPSNGSPKTTGCACSTICDYSGESYLWCSVSSCQYSWDYCTPP